jgi:phosphate-selective porin OprO and OprP
VFDGGPGAWEGILRFTNLDLDDGTITGGSFWRVTPTVNWYLSNNVRLFMSYGYCILDRYEKEGASNIFQARLMFML